MRTFEEFNVNAFKNYPIPQEEGATRWNYISYVVFKHREAKTGCPLTKSRRWEGVLEAVKEDMMLRVLREDPDAFEKTP